MLPCTAEALLYHWKASSVEHLGSMCLAQKHSERYFLGGGQSVFQSPPLCNMLRSAWLISSSNTPHICAATMTGVEQFTSHGSLCILLLRGHGSVQSVFYCCRQKHTCTSGLFSMCLCVWFVYVWFVCMCVCVCICKNEHLSYLHFHDCASVPSMLVLNVILIQALLSFLLWQNRPVCLRFIFYCIHFNFHNLYSKSNSIIV